MRGAPNVGFSATMREIGRAPPGPPLLGRPGTGLANANQYQRKPVRFQRATASGVTTISDLPQAKAHPFIFNGGRVGSPDRFEQRHCNCKARFKSVVAVGTTIADRPLRRSVRARLRIRLL